MTAANKTWKIALLDGTSVPGLCGHGTHLAFRGLPGVETVALVGANPDGITERLSETGARQPYTDCAEMLGTEKPDVLAICSHLPHEHLAPIEAAVRRGVHIFCEKPLAEENRTRIAVEGATGTLAVRYDEEHKLRLS